MHDTSPDPKPLCAPLLCSPKYYPDRGHEDNSTHLEFYGVLSGHGVGAVSSRASLERALKDQPGATYVQANTWCRLITLWNQNCEEYHNHETESPVSSVPSCPSTLTASETPSLSPAHQTSPTKCTLKAAATVEPIPSAPSTPTKNTRKHVPLVTSESLTKRTPARESPSKLTRPTLSKVMRGFVLPYRPGDALGPTPLLPLPLGFTPTPLVAAALGATLVLVLRPDDLFPLMGFNGAVHNTKCQLLTPKSPPPLVDISDDEDGSPPPDIPKFESEPEHAPDEAVWVAAQEQFAEYSRLRCQSLTKENIEAARKRPCRR
ncbi:hypothetical protein B0H10DRAFT_2026514 [Mycena sp. CBHHK59/15]|nr:hypothetical protein B0H10DRAFT_2026514 [Mycena sp. CBHHK59/15]